MIQIHEFLKSLTRTNMSFWFSEEWPQLFQILLGKLLSLWSYFSAVSALPKSAQPAQTVGNSHSFFNVSYTFGIILAGSHVLKIVYQADKNH